LFTWVGLGALAIGAACTVPAVETAPPEAAVEVNEIAAIVTATLETAPLETAPPIEEATQEVLAPTASETPSAPAATEQPAASRPRYYLKAAFNYGTGQVEVQQAVEYTHNSADSVSELVMLVEMNRYVGAFGLERLAWVDGTLVTDFRLQNNRLSIPLRQPLSQGETAAFELAYTLSLPPIPEPSDEYKPIPFGYTQRQANLVDWYAFFPPYTPEAGWLAHEAWFFGEHQVYAAADFEVEITVAGWAEPLILAASAQPEQQNGDTYRYRMEAARSFVISVSPYYQVYTQQVGGTTVYSYGLPYYEAGAQAALQYTAEALELYNRLFGEYARPSLSVVVADFLDGMEYDGLYFLSRGFYNLYDGTAAGYLTAIAVHETAHQWWYGQVGNDQAYEPWLDEALCTYSERLYYEFIRPELADWWWAFRVDLYEPQGAVNGAVYDYTGFRPYRDAVYLRGAQFLEEVRRAVGDEAFFGFLRAYVGQYTNGLATGQDFFSLLGEFSEADLSGLRQNYFK
jgi:hypothetical protein